ALARGMRRRRCNDVATAARFPIKARSKSVVALLRAIGGEQVVHSTPARVDGESLGESAVLLFEIEERIESVGVELVTFDGEPLALLVDVEHRQPVAGDDRNVRIRMTPPPLRNLPLVRGCVEVTVRGHWDFAARR